MILSEFLLLEFNIGRIVNDFGAKLTAKYTKEFNKTVPAETLVDELSKFDPTTNHEYTFWMAGNYARGGIPKWEDLGKTKEALEKYHKLKIIKKLPVEQRDINRVKSLSDLMDIIEQYPDQEAVSKNEEERSYEQELFADGEATLLYNDDKIKVIRTHSSYC